MYSWDDDTSSWYGKESYHFDASTKEARDAAAARAAAAGPRAYDWRQPPNPELINPSKKIRSSSTNPLIIAVDVTGSMSSWPFEIFDRLPLFYNTLTQYRQDLEISFAAIGDAGADRWPLQVTDFAKGYDLEQQLRSLCGEGGGGDAPESYGLFAWWVKHHVTVEPGEKPFLIVFGDAPMHPKVPAAQLRKLLGDSKVADADALDLWQSLTQNWQVWFLRRPTGSKGDEVDKQWSKAIGPHAVVRMHDEQRAVDYAMGLVARAWGRFEDFKKNMLARHDASRVSELEKYLAEKGPMALKCPVCGAPLPWDAGRRAVCEYCKSTIAL